jgi:hypothetical protein
MLVRFLSLLWIALPFCAEGALPEHDPDEGTLASGRLGIPEPMVYDLVRPLGAPKGELEINSLFLRPLSRGQSLQWAPEIEYTFAQGHGIEFEVPAEGGSIESFKLAVQGTVFALGREKTIWGWQVLAERWGHEKRWKGDFLLLNGVRWSSRWSTFSMLGPRRERASAHTASALVWNQSVFHHTARTFSVGVESNLASRGASGGAWLVTPQVTWRRSRYNFQAGAGMRQSEQRRRPLLAWRISREF